MNDLIKTNSIEDTRKDWLLIVEIDDPVNISITVIPDKLTADHSSIILYLKEMAAKEWKNPEQMILNVIEDINNTLVPKWLDVVYEKNGVTLKIEDRQPGLESLDLP